MKIALTLDVERRISMPTRTEVQTVNCPYCGAMPGSNCIGKRGDRLANHRERIKQYKRVGRRRHINLLGKR